MTIKLEPFTEKDFYRLIKWSPSEAFLKQWSPNFSYPLTEAQLHRHIETGNGQVPPEQLYRVVYEETGEVVGHGELGSIDLENRSARIKRVLVAPSYRSGFGVGTQIMQQLLQIAFEEMHLHRVDLHVLETNTSARRCYEKVGFVLEGIFREAYRREGGYLSTCRMSMLEQEWKSAIAPIQSDPLE